MGRANNPFLKAPLDSLLASIRSAKDDERAATLIVRILLIGGRLEELWGLPRIVRHRFEFAVAGGRIDLLLFHADDTATIVEVKAAGALRDVVAGIGQLCYYAAVIPERFKASHRPIRAVRRLLCSTLTPEKAVPVMDACRVAGVIYGHLPTYPEFHAMIAHLRNLELVD